MEIFYAEKEQQQGPVSCEELHQRIQRGELSQETLVFTEGMTDWTPFSRAVSEGKVPGLPETRAPLQTTLRVAGTPDAGAAKEGTVACPTCGTWVAAGELIPFENRKLCPHCRDRVLQQMREGVAITTVGELRYAGFGARLGSFILDYIIMQVYSQILSFVLLGVSTFDQGNSVASGIAVAAYFVLSIGGSYFYYIYLMGSPKHQATLGMKALKLKVVRSDGSPITKWRAFGRMMATVISGLLLGIGYLMVLWDKEKATLHDRIADTRIVFK